MPKTFWLFARFKDQTTSKVSDPGCGNKEQNAEINIKGSMHPIY